LSDVGTRFVGVVSFAHVRLLGERVFGLHFTDCLIRTRRPVVRFSITEYAGSCFGCGGWERECWFGRKHFGINLYRLRDLDRFDHPVVWMIAVAPRGGGDVRPRRDSVSFAIVGFPANRCLVSILL